MSMSNDRADRELAMSGVLGGRVLFDPVEDGGATTDAPGEASRRVGERVRQLWFEGYDPVGIVFARSDAFLEGRVAGRPARQRPGRRIRR
jgi:hypothetical protein